jgi:hypothetical protein
MAANAKEMAQKIVKAIWTCTRICTVNTWRRTLMLGRYSLICWQQQKLRRTLRTLGTQIFRAQQQGEVNPLLVDEVKDTLKRARELQAVKDRHYQAVQTLRDKIRSACACAPQGRGSEPPPAGGSQDAAG